MGEPGEDPKALLRAFLAADEASREATASGVVLLSVVLILPLSLGAYLSGSTSIDPQVLLSVVAAELLLAAYELPTLLLLRAGRYHPAVPWASTLVESAVPALIVMLITFTPQPVLALTSPVYVLWGAVLVLGALRVRPKLSLACGVLAAAQWLAIFALALRPRLLATSPAAAAWLAAVVRAILLLLAGLGGAALGRAFVSKAEATLAAVRERDLMGKYLLGEKLGAGGMAEVFRATYCPEGGFRKEVAVKRVLPELSRDPAFTARFLEEAGVGARLAHPNIVQVFDCGRFQGQHILTMEWMDGPSLARLLRRAGPLPPAAVAYLGAEIANALEYLHSRRGPDGRPLDIVHRDLNPPNVLLSRLGEVKVSDFGVAAVAAATGRSSQFVGKVSYAAPEQLRGERLDHRTDLFALGLVLYEALTGQRAIQGDPEAILRAGALPPIAPLSGLRPDVPAELEALIRKLLQPDPALRPRSGSLVREALLGAPREWAPYPDGARLLAEAVAACAGEPPEPRPAEVPTATTRETAVGPTVSSRRSG